jgi:hypothetical protein
LNIVWGDVTKLRDHLRAQELAEREHADGLHRAAAVFWGGQGAANFWRGYFLRRFGKIVREGRDCTAVPRFDEFVAQHCRTHGEAHEAANYDAGGQGWTADDVWELLTTERPPLKPIWDHYEAAIKLIAAQDIDGFNSSSPF